MEPNNLYLLFAELEFWIPKQAKQQRQAQWAGPAGHRCVCKVDGQGWPTVSLLFISVLRGGMQRSEIFQVSKSWQPLSNTVDDQFVDIPSEAVTRSVLPRHAVHPCGHYYQRLQVDLPQRSGAAVKVEAPYPTDMASCQVLTDSIDRETTGCASSCSGPCGRSSSRPRPCYRSCSVSAALSPKAWCTQFVAVGHRSAECSLITFSVFPVLQSAKRSQYRIIVGRHTKSFCTNARGETYQIPSLRDHIIHKTKQEHVIHPIWP